MAGREALCGSEIPVGPAGFAARRIVAVLAPGTPHLVVDVVTRVEALLRNAATVGGAAGSPCATRCELAVPPGRGLLRPVKRPHTVSAATTL